MSRTFENPNPASPHRISRRPPILSNSHPKTGWLNPPSSVPSDAANDTCARLHPNSSLIGMMNTPNPLYAPFAAMEMNTHAATTNQP